MALLHSYTFTKKLHTKTWTNKEHSFAEVGRKIQIIICLRICSVVNEQNQRNNIIAQLNSLIQFRMPAAFFSAVERNRASPAGIPPVKGGGGVREGETDKSGINGAKLRANTQFYGRIRITLAD